MNGIDISNWQAGLDVRSLPVDFCICKATEGIGFVDGTCDWFVQQCIESGKLWGFYHFARENDPVDEANYFYENCKNYFGQGVPVLDYEIDNYDNREWCERFINRVHELSGVWCLLYISASRCPQYHGSWLPDKCGLWVAGYPWPNPNWTDEPMPYDVSPFPWCVIWQFTSSLQLGGMNLDGNVAYIDRDQWMRYVAGDSAPAPAPAPAPVKGTDELVREVLAGWHGEGDARRASLGWRYDEVQNRIDELYEIADAVIRGEWGNGWNREQALNGCGYPYDIVQGIVNAKLG